uniref:RNase H type-1 domain-containing protein n=1 Tax=Cajanus cajan TaxID=3821 RepID=A0A151U9S7_CAJCA|nr:hypothetical protein KK1_020278 [Cajanus cajan]
MTIVWGQPRLVGFGGILRGLVGNWLKCFYGDLGLGNNMKTKLSGLLFGLCLAWRLGYKDVLCVSDSFYAILLE